MSSRGKENSRDSSTILLREFRASALLRRLLALPDQLWGKAEPEVRRNASGKPTISDAQLYRDCLAIALLAVVPLRRSNLAHLSIGRNLLQVGGEWVICLS